MSKQWDNHGSKPLETEADRGVKAWRQLRERFGVIHQKPTYDAYPDDEMPPEVRFYVEARDVKGRLRREYVHLDGYSVNQLNWKMGATRGGVRITDWFAGRMLEALYALNATLAEVADEKKERKEFNYDPRTGAG